MKKRISFLFLCCFLLCAAPVYGAEKTVSFSYLSTYTGEEGQAVDAKWHCVYSDSYFSESAFKYRQDLALASLCLSMAAFNSAEGEQQDYTQKGKNAEALLSQLGFSDIELFSYEKKPSMNSVGAAFGQKEIILGEKPCTLIAVAIRGNGYESEWVGNFRVGSGTAHKGFQRAADQVLKELCAYLDAHQEVLQPNLKLWICGYSRGAAAANLAGAKLDQGKGLTEKGISLEPEDIYIYGFEVPRTTKDSRYKEACYGNIFSIVNGGDFVGEMPLRSWGYQRYGITKFLPAAQTAAGYGGMEDARTGIYKEITGGKKCRMEDSWSVVMTELIKSLGSSFPTVDRYSEFLIRLLLDGQTRNEEGLDWTYVLESVFAGGQKEELDEALSALGVDDKKGEKRARLLISQIKRAHYPELCLSWMEAVSSGKAEFPSSEYFVLKTRDKADIWIYDSNRELKAAVENGKIRPLTESRLVHFVKSDGMKIFYLPADETYLVRYRQADGKKRLMGGLSKSDLSGDSQELISSCDTIAFEAVPEADSGKNLLRIQFLTALFYLEQETVDFEEVLTKSFEKPNKKAVEWAKKQGILKGYGDGTFRLDGCLSRQEMVTLLCRFTEQDGAEEQKKTVLSRFPDTGELASYASGAMGWAVSSGLIRGKGELLAPGETATRAEAEALLMRWKASK